MIRREMISSMINSLKVNISRFGWRGCLLSLFSKVSRITGWHAVLKLPIILDGVTRGFVKVRVGTSDLSVYTDVFERQDLRPPECNDLRFIIDAGAYTGLSSVYFSILHPNARIVAIEPDFENFMLLQENVRHFKNIECLNMGLWGHSSVLATVSSKKGHWGTTTKEITLSEGAHDSIKGVTLSEIIAMFDVDSVDLLKMDIEGAEKEVLENAFEWIDNVRILMVETHDRKVPGCRQALMSVTPKFTTILDQGEKVVCTR